MSQDTRYHPGYFRNIKPYLIALGVVCLSMFYYYGFSQSNHYDGIPVFTQGILNTFSHDTGAFTQGLIFHNGYLYESTGQYGQSSLRKVDLKTGKVLKSISLPKKYFGEGLTVFDNKLYQLTWRSHQGMIYDLESFELLQEFHYSTEGWGLTHDDEHLIMSDGSSVLHYIDPYTLTEVGKLEVWDANGAVEYINELEFIYGEIWANIYPTNAIARISPESGQVTAYIVLSNLLDANDMKLELDVPNGIAYDEEKNKIYVTGKLWPKLFEIELLPLEINR